MYPYEKLSDWGTKCGCFCQKNVEAARNVKFANLVSADWIREGSIATLLIQQKYVFLYHVHKYS